MNDRTHFIVMGVAGCGKTTLATALSERLGWSYAEADDFHSVENITKMANGIPLKDDDRWPWLTAIKTWITEKSAADESTIVTCSALKRSYRDLLASADGEVVFIHLHGDAELIRSRMAGRSGHFMPESLLASQFETLEALADDECGIAVANTGKLEQTIDAILRRLSTDTGECEAEVAQRRG
ncbi:gluconokinase [Arthrobacter sp. EH-1B-1]|uniref:Gluconokinase n=1 Tax=Arthrobacter vasquezii TaxID=2977629 RepID=A0ABT6CQA4_9MICC|nr:gluconokinase [Arthrobacter vasquezii]MDF9276294.1 gluconokinase [Arthrobacter vasquezii]